MSKWLNRFAIVVAIVAGFALGSVTWPLVISWTGGLALSTRFAASDGGVVASRIVERDFRKRLRSVGEQPDSASCHPDLEAREGAASRCEATFKRRSFPSTDMAPEVRTGWLADRAEYLVSKVDGRAVSVDITPGLSGRLLESALSQMLYTATYLDCPTEGIRGKVGETVSCQGNYGYPDGPCMGTVVLARCTLLIEVDRVTGMSLGIRIAQVTPPAVR